MFEVQLLSHVFRTRFRIALASVDKAPAKKVADIHDVWFRSRTGALEMLE